MGDIVYRSKLPNQQMAFLVGLSVEPMGWIIGAGIGVTVSVLGQ
jgi:hypothetical protein